MLRTIQRFNVIFHAVPYQWSSRWARKWGPGHRARWSQTPHAARSRQSQFQIRPWATSEVFHIRAQNNTTFFSKENNYYMYIWLLLLSWFNSIGRMGGAGTMKWEVMRWKRASMTRCRVKWRSNKVDKVHIYIDKYHWIELFILQGEISEALKSVPETSRI